MVMASLFKNPVSNFAKWKTIAAIQFIIILVLFASILSTFWLFRQSHSHVKPVQLTQYQVQCRCDRDHYGNTTTTANKICLYQWSNFRYCISDLDDMREVKLFPRNPSQCRSVDSLDLTEDTENYGQRIFGYIHPPKNAFYVFAIAADDTAELWLSPDIDPEKMKKIAYVEPWQKVKANQFNLAKNQQSIHIYLQANKKYFIEILHAQAEKKGFVQVAWKITQRRNSKFTIITSRYLSLTQNYIYNMPGYTVQRFRKAGHGLQMWHKKQKENVPFAKKFHLLPKLDSKYLDGIKSKCTYKSPSYVLQPGKPIKSYTAPFYLQRIPHRVYGHFNFRTFYRDNLVTTNTILPSKVAHSLTKAFMKVLKKENKNRFDFVKTHNIEEKVDDKHGSRFLFEAVVMDTYKNKLYRVSEYFQRSSEPLSFKATKLCHLTDLSWDPTTEVYVVIAIKQQGQWLRYLIHQLSRYYNQTHDNHFTLVIADFNSTDIDIPAVMKASSLSRYHIMNIRTKNFQFSRTVAINRAAAWIDDDDAILIMYDLHITFPPDMLDNVRKRCKKGKAAYFPIVTRLGCGFLPKNPNGYPEVWGFGLAAFYKSDYEAIGGMDDQKYQFDWGGEDSDIADRTLSNALEIERLLHPYLFHYYHRRLPWKKAINNEDEESQEEKDVHQN